MASLESSGETVFVAMSGGVDSSVAAVLLHEQGYKVVGVMMRLWAEEGGPANRCCSPQAIDDARRVCQMLGVPFHVLDYEAEFKRRVVDYFIAEYGRGRTPNPCLACNRHIKFGLLLRKALASGANYLATGHYSRVRPVNGQYELLKGVHANKDQSYVLYMLGQDELAHLLLPLGTYTKGEVRTMAQERRLPAAEREESQEVCFTLGDYRPFLRRQPSLVFEPGPILDPEGNVIGQHKGLPAYTIGQREGLGIAAPHPLYVLEIDTGNNALIVGPQRLLVRHELTARGVNFVAGKPPLEPARITAKIRYRAEEAEATLTPAGEDEVTVRFVEPQAAVTPGQAVVFYQGDIVVGGGIIERAR